MKRSELERLLGTEGIPEHAYSLDGGLPGDALCVGKIASGWEVYYSERGQKNQRRVFRSEHKAYDHFYSQLMEVADELRQRP